MTKQLMETKGKLAEAKTEELRDAVESAVVNYLPESLFQCAFKLKEIYSLLQTETESSVADAVLDAFTGKTMEELLASSEKEVA